MCVEVMIFSLKGKKEKVFFFKVLKVFKRKYIFFGLLLVFYLK